MKVINIKTNKFKSNVINIILPLSLNEKVTDFNLIALILKRGSRMYPSFKEIWKQMEELYGAVFEIMITKKGEKLLLNFYIQFIDNRYALYTEDILEEAVKFLSEVINNPIIDNGEFKNEYFYQELENLKVLINSKIDNKDEYVIEKAAEECCKGEPYSIYQYGNIDRLNSIINNELASLWINTIKKSKFFVVACGNIDEENLKRVVNKYIPSNDGYTEEQHINILKDDKLIEKFEKLNINQGKLCLCLKTNINICKGDYFALSVLNSVLGGGTHSKLFKEVRESNSLAYYIYSFVEKYKGLLFVTAGIEFDNYTRVKEIILKQIENIKIGNITEIEIESSKKKIISDLKSSADSILGTIDYIGSLRIYGIKYEVSDVITGIEGVSKERIIEASNNLKFGCIYFLQNQDVLEV